MALRSDLINPLVCICKWSLVNPMWFIPITNCLMYDLCLDADSGIVEIFVANIQFGCMLLLTS